MQIHMHIYIHIHYRGPSRDQICYLQTDATLPVVQRNRVKTQSQRHGWRGTWDWQSIWNAMVLISTPVCVNFKLRPGSGEMHICPFDFGALVHWNAYNTHNNRLIIVDQAEKNLQTDARMYPYTYRKVSNIRRTKSKNLNDSRIVLQLSLPSRLKPGVKSRMKM